MDLLKPLKKQDRDLSNLHPITTALCHLFQTILFLIKPDILQVDILHVISHVLSQTKTSLYKLLQEILG